MELMDRSLDQLYKLVYEKLKLRIPESVVGKMAEAVRSLYKYLACDLLSIFVFHCVLFAVCTDRVYFFSSDRESSPLSES